MLPENGALGAVWSSIDGIDWQRVPDDQYPFGGPDVHHVLDVVE